MSEPLLNVVCDAGPLIHLDEVGCLDLLKDFPTILIPDQVWQEAEYHRPRIFSQQPTVFTKVVISISTDAIFQSVIHAFALDRGEQAALTLMQTHPSAIFLTDDAAARLAAQSLRYRVHGTIGILLRSIRRSQRTRENVLDILRTLPIYSTLYIRPQLLQSIIAEVERTTTTQ
jgi:predicted nucleic acid-binding protein